MKSTRQTLPSECQAEVQVCSSSEDAVYWNQTHGVDEFMSCHCLFMSEHVRGCMRRLQFSFVCGERANTCKALVLTA